MYINVRKITDESECMADLTIETVMVTSGVQDNLVSQFRQDYLSYQALFKQQTPLVQRFLETQAASMAEAIVHELTQLKFTLPDRVILVTNTEVTQTRLLQVEARDQLIGGLLERLIHTDLRTALRSRLLELQQSTDPAIVASAILVKYALVVHMIHNMLPAGRSVRYTTLDGDEIPTLPLANNTEARSAFTAYSDAKTVEDEFANGKQAEVQVPYVEAARRFYLPQWVAFDDQGRLLVASENEAEADIASMQRYLSILHAAVGLAPYMVANEEYQQKRYGILGQLVNQGRALAHYQTNEIIQVINRRAAAHDLDRGLSLSLPYFNDQTLQIEKYDFDVIPAGRVMFIPAFVVMAVRAQGAKIVQDTRLSQSTRRQLLQELGTLEESFLR